MYLILVFLAYLFTLVDSQEASFRYDYKYYSLLDGWLKLHQIPAAYHDAFLRCNLEGSILAYPTDKHMEAAMRQEMKNKRITWNGIFIENHRTTSKGDFSSVKGSTINSMSIEPDIKSNDQDCTLYVANGTIADVNCNELRPYICFKKRTKNVKGW